jgi:hypothetical protein
MAPTGGPEGGVERLRQPVLAGRLPRRNKRSAEGVIACYCLARKATRDPNRHFPCKAALCARAFERAWTSRPCAGRANRATPGTMGQEQVRGPRKGLRRCSVLSA